MGRPLARPDARARSYRRRRRASAVHAIGDPAAPRRRPAASSASIAPSRTVATSGPARVIRRPTPSGGSSSGPRRAPRRRQPRSKQPAPPERAPPLPSPPAAPRRKLPLRFRPALLVQVRFERGDFRGLLRRRRRGGRQSLSDRAHVSCAAGTPFTRCFGGLPDQIDKYLECRRKRPALGSTKDRAPRPGSGKIGLQRFGQLCRQAMIDQPRSAANRMGCGDERVRTARPRRDSSAGQELLAASPGRDCAPLHGTRRASIALRVPRAARQEWPPLKWRR